MKIKILLASGAKIPYRSTDGAAGWDLFAYLEKPLTLHLGDSLIVPTGVFVQLPPGTYWDARVRSGLSTKHCLMLLNGAAVIDEDYRGMVGIPLINMGVKPYTIMPGEKIAQVILKRYEIQEFEIVDKLDLTERGEGGFGHTGRT